MRRLAAARRRTTPALCCCRAREASGRLCRRNTLGDLRLDPSRQRKQLFGRASRLQCRAHEHDCFRRRNAESRQCTRDA